MFKKIATGVLAVAATSALALSLPSAANASTAHHDDDSYSWGSVYSRNHQAKAFGRVDVDWDRHHESNEVTVRGRLYDLDSRSARQGGKCAYVMVAFRDLDHGSSRVYSKKYCGYPGSTTFFSRSDDVESVRVKVCQIGQHSNFPTRCGRWQSIYSSESE